MFKSKLKIVDQLRVGSPCPVSNFEQNADQSKEGWFCKECVKPVYDLAKLSRREIDALINRTDGHFCAAISRRADGSIITNDPMSASATLLSKGILLASTALISSSAVAESERGDVALPEPTPGITQLRGEVEADPTPAAEEKSECQESQSEAEATPIPESAESPPQMEVGLVAPVER